MSTTEIEQLKQANEKLKEEVLNSKLDKIQNNVSDNSTILKQFMKDFKELQLNLSSVPKDILTLKAKVKLLETETKVVRFLTKNPKVAIVLIAGLYFIALYDSVFSKLFHLMK